MSLKLGYTIFYTAFLFFYIFFTLDMGISVLNIDQQSLENIISAGNLELTGIGILDFFVILVNNIISFFNTFGLFLTISVSPDFLFMNFIFIPFTIGMIYLIFAFIRGDN